MLKINILILNFILLILKVISNLIPDSVHKSYRFFKIFLQKDFKYFRLIQSYYHIWSNFSIIPNKRYFFSLKK